MSLHIIRQLHLTARLKSWNRFLLSGNPLNLVKVALKSRHIFLLFCIINKSCVMIAVWIFDSLKLVLRSDSHITWMQLKKRVRHWVTEWLWCDWLTDCSDTLHLGLSGGNNAPRINTKHILSPEITSGRRKLTNWKDKQRFSLHLCPQTSRNQSPRRTSLQKVSLSFQNKDILNCLE